MEEQVQKVNEVKTEVKTYDFDEKELSLLIFNWLRGFLADARIKPDGNGNLIFFIKGGDESLKTSVPIKRTQTFHANFVRITQVIMKKIVEVA